LEADKQLLYLIYTAIFGSMVGSFLNVVIHRLPEGESPPIPSHCPKCEKRISRLDFWSLCNYVALGPKCRKCGEPITLPSPFVKVGSFLGLIIYRLPRTQSIVSPPSHCPKCNHRIRWFDNIPLFSYVVLGGKCRDCKTGISLRYPFVEFITAFFFVAFYATDIIGIFGNATSMAVFAIHCALISALIAITFIDFDLRIIPDEISVGGTVVALCLGALLPGVMFPIPQFFGGLEPHLAGCLTSMLGAAVGAGMTYATGELGRLAFKKEAMGLGDVKLMAMLGGLLGWQAAVVIFFIAPFAGLVIALPRKLITGDSYIAYGPFLAIACVVYIFFEPYARDFLPVVFF